MFNNKTKNFIAISDAFEIVSGGTPKRKQPEFWGGNIPWISIKDFNDSGKYILNTEEFITKKGLEKSSTNVLYENDIIISARGTVGKINLIRDTMAFNQSCYGLRANNKINPIFGYYALKNSVRLLLSRAYGSVFSTITIRTFNEVKIPFFDKITQENIANLLSSFDDKIENNNAIIAILEEQAMVMFKSKFMNNEPFDEKKMQLTKLGNLFSFIKGKKPNNIIETFKEGSVPYLVKKYIDSNDITYVKDNDGILIDDLDVFMLMDGANSGNIYYGYHGILGSTFSWLKNDNVMINEYIYWYLRINQEEVRNQNTGSAIPHANKDYINNMEVRLPTDINESLTLTALKNIRLYSINLRRENNNLAEIRDTLLPKLMSGEIRVGDVVAAE